MLPYAAAADTARVAKAAVTPETGEPSPTAVDDGVAWLCLTHDVTRRRGSSKGFSLLSGWAPAYPETTGYVIGTLLAYGAGRADPEYDQRAEEMGDWELEVQNNDGGVMEGAVQSPARPSIVFNTGMVIHGWLDLHERLSRGRHLEAAERAGHFLLSRQDRDGAWRGPNQYAGIPHVYDARVAWALVRLANVAGDRRYRDAAIRALDWVLSMQESDGWFNACVFKPGMRPSTHGLAYTLRGLLESAVLLEANEYLEAASRTSEVLIRKLEVLGRLPGAFECGWIPAVRYECLTGTAQLGGVWLRLYEVTGDPRFLNAGLKAVEQAARRQATSRWTEIHGALPGSFPIYGRYAPLQFPNWATKFLVDSLMLRDRLVFGLP